MRDIRKAIINQKKILGLAWNCLHLWCRIASSTAHNCWVWTVEQWSMCGINGCEKLNIGSFEISILKFYSHGGPFSSDWVAKFIKCQPGVIKTQTRWYLAAPILTTTLKSSDFFQLKPDVMGLNSHHSGLYFYIIVFNWSPWWCFFEEFYATQLPVLTAMRIQYIISPGIATWIHVGFGIYACKIDPLTFNTFLIKTVWWPDDRKKLWY